MSQTNQSTQKNTRKRLLPFFTALLSLAVLCCGFLAGMKFFRYLDTDDTSSVAAYTRLMMHELYTSAENVDTLFVGSSHVYLSTVPEIYDEMVGGHSFNGGSSAQDMDTSYAIVKEAIRCHTVSTVYLDMYYSIALAEASYSAREDATSVYLIADQMPNQLARANYLIRSAAPNYINAFIVARRNWENLLDLDAITTLVSAKQQTAYTTYAGASGSDGVYVERGYVATEGCYEDTPWPHSLTAGYTGIDTSAISEDYLTYVEKIAALCAKNDVELIFYMVPEAECTLMGGDAYDTYHDYVAALADSLGITFYDFNLCKKEYFDSTDMSLMHDLDHLNAAGAKVFTQMLAQLAVGEIAEADLFYASFEEKLLAEENVSIHGVVNSTDERGSYIVTTRREGYEYEVSVMPDDGEEMYVIREFSEDLFFILPDNTYGSLHIECRDATTWEVVDVVEMSWVVEE